MKAMNMAMDRVSVILQGVRIVCVRGRVRPGKCVRAEIRGRSNADREKIGTRWVGIMIFWGSISIIRPPPKILLCTPRGGAFIGPGPHDTTWGLAVHNEEFPQFFDWLNREPLYSSADLFIINGSKPLSLYSFGSRMLNSDKWQTILHFLLDWSSVESSTIIICAKDCDNNLKYSRGLIRRVLQHNCFLLLLFFLSI